MAASNLRLIYNWQHSEKVRKDEIEIAQLKSDMLALGRKPGLARPGNPYQIGTSGVVYLLKVSVYRHNRRTRRRIVLLSVDTT